MVMPWRKKHFEKSLNDPQYVKMTHSPHITDTLDRLKKEPF